ncbi:hypothetical protein ACFP2T_16500 [Plantactinospora solaniradicis]|uniref:Ferredoxin n=1 Tax=Plantactinospora solaniradicis TaxID=1723736 RepID=A0ABW1K9W3_9ACTN
MSTPEPEWSEEDQAWMLALAEYRAGLCPACRRPLRECADPDADGGYTVPSPTRCHATTALLIAQEQYTESPQAGALLFHTERRG